jgi:hypothetical protein
VAVTPAGSGLADRLTATALKDRAPRWVKDAADAGTRGFGLCTARLRDAPDFLVIGTKRGGTTSLFNYLLMHPGVMGLFPAVRGKKSTDYFFKQYHRGDRWYRSHFQTNVHRKVLSRRLGYEPIGGEASPYYVWDPRIAPRVHSVAPQVRAIMLLRDPVERAWSHYQERRQNGVEPLDFAQALEAEHARTEGELERMAAEPLYYSEAHDWYTYRSRGVYLPQIQNWRAVFPQRQLLVLRSEDMYQDPQTVFDTVCDFLEVPRFELRTTRTFNARFAVSSIPAEQRADLRSYFEPHNSDLEKYLGRRLNWT